MDDLIKQFPKWRRICDEQTARGSPCCYLPETKHMVAMMDAIEMLTQSRPEEDSPMTEVCPLTPHGLLTIADAIERRVTSRRTASTTIHRLHKREVPMVIAALRELARRMTNPVPRVLVGGPRND